MCRLSLVIVGLLLARSTLGAEEQDELRDPRWFIGGRTVTQFLLDNRVVTEVTPSSCVIVQTALPACKSLRALKVDPSPPTRMQMTKVVELADTDAIRGKTFGTSWGNRYAGGPVVQPSEPIVQPSLSAPTEVDWSLGTGWLWGQDTTVTSTIHASETLKFQDPKHVVTFSVTGCKPSRMPFDLDYCDKTTKVP